jgi:long-chain acyl-CoA synthetase
VLVQHFLEHSAERSPWKVALVCDGQRLTYGELENRSNRLARAFRHRGLERGERVVLYLPNSIELVVGIFAALKAGGVSVVINYTTKAHKLAYILNNCQASLLLTSRQRLSSAQKLAREVASLRTVMVAGVPAGEELPAGLLSYEAVQVDYPLYRLPAVNIDLDLACLIYTSGSTGDPKGVMSDHSNVVFASGSIIEYLQNVPGDVVIDVLPLSFDYGLYQLFMVFRFGGTLVLEKGFAYPAAILKRMEEERVTGFPGVPTIFAVLQQMDIRTYDLGCLRYLTNTAAALPPSHIKALQAMFPQARLYSMYGLTETKRTLYLPPDEVDRRPGSVGIAIPGTEVWLEDEAGNRLGPGQTGELVVRGRHVMRGYWGDEEATRRRYRPGPIPGERLCYTGDLFSMDEQGFFYFVARRDDIIKCRGEKVAPKEVENVLYALGGVREAAVVGVPDPIQGQAVKAFVVAGHQEMTEAQVLAHCRANLEDFMVPKYVELCTQLPKTTSGKIKKSDLQ